MTVMKFMTVIGFAGLFFSVGIAIGRIVERLSSQKYLSNKKIPAQLRRN